MAMPKVLRHTLLSLRDLLATAGPFVALALALLLIAYWVLDPTPPRRVVLATGVEQGAYAEFGKRYAEALKRHGITVELRATQGAAENLALLRDANSGVQVAFVQGGADDGERSADDGNGRDRDLVSLGSMFFEPVWLFYREDSARRLLKPVPAAAPPRPGKPAPARGPALQRADDVRLVSLSQLAGWRVNVGAPGSGVPPLMDLLLGANRIDPSTIQLSRQPLTPAVVEFLDARARCARHRIGA